MIGREKPLTLLSIPRYRHVWLLLVTSVYYWCDCWFCNHQSYEAKKSERPYLKGSTGGNVKECFLPVWALMTRLCPHRSVHRGNASHSQINIESTCERKCHAQPHIQTNTATNMHRKLETFKVIVTLASLIVMSITKHRYIPLQKIKWTEKLL